MHDWAYVMTSTRGQWLPGDERGFRDHGHRVHSTGDYRTPPPPDEHAGLRRFSKKLADEPIVLTVGQRCVVGALLLEKLHRIPVRVSALACAATHAHALILAGELDAKDLLGRAKQFASHAMRETFPGKLWGASSHIVRIRDERHFDAVRTYIHRHASEGAWVWTEGDERPIR